MKNTFFLYLYILLLCTSCWQCKSTKSTGNYELSRQNNIFLADSIKSAELIINDVTDDIFAKISEIDMCIQMKRNYPPETFRSQILDDYMLFLQRDVSNFNENEIAFVQKTMKEVFKLTSKINSNIFPKQINIIKTKGKHYGDGVYYTRENCIVVPADVLKKQNKDEFLSTMIHEVFHVYSRLNPEKRKSLYELIGFQHLEKSQLIIPTGLKNRILLNPDGVDYQYFISLQMSPDKEVKAVPIIYSNEIAFKKTKSAFFNYLKFELFEIKPNSKGIMEVITKKDGTSTLNMKELPDFWRQIRDNTQYIIHPDEVLADNFMFLVLSQKNKNTQEKFSSEGKQLIEEIEKIVKE